MKFILAASAILSMSSIAFGHNDHYHNHGRNMVTKHECSAATKGGYYGSGQTYYNPKTIQVEFCTTENRSGRVQVISCDPNNRNSWAVRVDIYKTKNRSRMGTGKFYSDDIISSNFGSNDFYMSVENRSGMSMTIDTDRPSLKIEGVAGEDYNKRQSVKASLRCDVAWDRQIVDRTPKDRHFHGHTHFHTHIHNFNRSGLNRIGQEYISGRVRRYRHQGGPAYFVLLDRNGYGEMLVTSKDRRMHQELKRELKRAGSTRTMEVYGTVYRDNKSGAYIIDVQDFERQNLSLRDWWN